MNHWDLLMFPWSRDTPRFYPPGQHPANLQERIQLRKLRGLREQMERARETRMPRRRMAPNGEIVVDSPYPQLEDFRQIDEAIAYHESRIAAFEQVESELKAEAWRRTGQS